MSTKRRDFLVEIGTEELPPKSLPELSRAFTTAVTAGLAAAGLAHGAVSPYAAPRRLALLVPRLAERQADQRITRKGPPVAAAFDASGQATRAATAFAESCGTTVESLGRVSEPKGDFLHYTGIRPGGATLELLPGIVKAALDGLPIARRMRWGAGTAEFVRPVHWIVMLFGRDVVPCTLLDVPAGRHTRGHRFHAPRAINITAPSRYAALLETKGHVIADFALRRERIRSGVTALAQSLGGEALLDEALLDEVTALVEWPVPVAGRFEERFLSLPPEVVISTVQDHQRYFPLRDGAGKLTPWFVTVANIDSKDPAQVRAGNERVVRPRLADAAFFWDTDRAQPLAARREALGAATFQAQLGSVLAKTTRVAALAERIAQLTTADPGLTRRAAELAKCDLMTAMVGEFPELQGLMGRYYAAHDGEPAEVAAAIEEQYRPRYAGDALPGTDAGTALAVADKLDTIVGIFAAGQKPSGTKDPFGLRRAALGVLRILIEKRLELDLVELIEFALERIRSDMHAVAVAKASGSAGTSAVGSLSVSRDGQDVLIGAVYDYVMERLRAYYLETAGGVTTEMFDAVLARRPTSPLDFDARLRALAEFMALPDAASLASANKRIANILRKSEDALAPRVDSALLKHSAELGLAREIENLREEVETLLAERRYEAALRRLATLRPHVDAFFDGVMVMAEEPAVRANRLALLAALQRLFIECADLSRLPG
jgi:glycyl-tRNA synthetase beta chain